jgi:hypothetical protein
MYHRLSVLGLAVSVSFVSYPHLLRQLLAINSVRQFEWFRRTVAVVQYLGFYHDRHGITTDIRRWIMWRGRNFTDI